MSYKKEKRISNREIAHLLRSIEAAYLIKNVNRFRTIAYQNAADTVEKMTREIKDVWQEGNLDKIPGIGSTIASALDEFFRKGYSRHFQQALKGIPQTVFELMKVPSIGPKKAFKLAKIFKLKNPETVFADLRKLSQADKIAKVPSFGKKSQELIIKALDLYAKRAKSPHRMPLPYAYALANEIIEYLKKNKFVKRTDALGSLRRMVATIGDIDIAIGTDKKHISEIIEYFINYPKKISVDNKGGKKASIIVLPQIRIDLRVQERENYGPMLQYFTGSKTHNILLREFALKRGYSLSEYGIKEVKKNKNHTFRTEEEFYKFLGLEYIPPEIREGTKEIEMALRKKLPKLIEEKDVRGDLHIHSNYDLKPSHDFGRNTYEEIVKKAIDLNYSYTGFSDHNPKTGSLSSEEITSILKNREQYIKKKLARIKRNNFGYFVGLEVDISPTGKLAVPEQAQKFLDYMIVSVHSAFNLDSKTMTKRVLEALKNEKAKILAHPTGRLLGKREGYELEWEKIFDFCKKNNVALEINAWPERLDLPDSLVYDAIQAGVRCVINTDAHANFHMDNMKYGVAVARRGWAKKSDIINTYNFKEFKKWLTN